MIPSIGLRCGALFPARLAGPVHAQHAFLRAANDAQHRSVTPRGMRVAALTCDAYQSPHRPRPSPLVAAPATQPIDSAESLIE